MSVIVDLITIVYTNYLFSDFCNFREDFVCLTFYSNSADPRQRLEAVCQHCEE